MGLSFRDFSKTLGKWPHRKNEELSSNLTPRSRILWAWCRW